MSELREVFSSITVRELSVHNGNLLKVPKEIVSASPKKLKRGFLLYDMVPIFV